MQTLDWILRHAENMYADREAVIDGDTRLTYRELGERCRRLGTALRHRGIGHGDRVATLMANSSYYMELHLSIPAIGAVTVPLNSRLSTAEMQYILADSGATVLITDEAHVGTLEELRPHVRDVIVCPHDYDALLADSRPDPLPGPKSEDALAGLYYTGGTTGPAKGVMLSHRNLVNQNYMLGFAGFFESEMTFLYIFPLFHLAAIGSIYGLTWSGARQVFLPAVDPEKILSTIETEQVTHTSMVPTVISALLNHPAIDTANLTSLLKVTHGAAPIAPDLCKKAVETFGAAFSQAYGMTEASAVVSMLEDEQLLLEDERIRSAGRALPGCEIVVRRADGTPCLPREAGEITLRSDSVMQGYWKKPEQTAEVLRGGWYWSGDVGYQDDNHYLYIVDRAKDMIITGGENVYSIETETALLAHDAVQECAVIGIPHDKWGEAVHAIIYLKPGHHVEEAELIAHCRERIAGYKCPKSITLSDTDLPKSSVGKILKRKLRAPHWEDQDRNTP